METCLLNFMLEKFWPSKAVERCQPRGYICKLQHHLSMIRERRFSTGTKDPPDYDLWSTVAFNLKKGSASYSYSFGTNHRGVTFQPSFSVRLRIALFFILLLCSSSYSIDLQIPLPLSFFYLFSPLYASRLLFVNESPLTWCLVGRSRRDRRSFQEDDKSE